MNIVQLYLVFCSTCFYGRLDQHKEIFCAKTAFQRMSRVMYISSSPSDIHREMNIWIESHFYFRTFMHPESLLNTDTFSISLLRIFPNFWPRSLGILIALRKVFWCLFLTCYGITARELAKRDREWGLWRASKSSVVRRSEIYRKYPHL